MLFMFAIMFCGCLELEPVEKPEFNEYFFSVFGIPSKIFGQVQDVDGLRSLVLRLFLILLPFVNKFVFQYVILFSYDPNDSL